MAKTLARFFSVVIILSILLAQFGLKPVAAAANFDVNSTADEGDANLQDQICETSTFGECTLRAAVQQANWLEGSDTITIPAGTYTLSLEGMGEDAAASGDLDVTDSLSISGAGMGSTIIEANSIDANNPDRAFHVLSGTLDLSDLTVKNGIADPGGAVLVNSYASITRVAFSNNQSPSRASNGTGGAIYVSVGASADISQSQFTGNVANFGGGAVASGGAVDSANSSQFTVSDSTFTSNSGGFGGGALYPNGISASITNSTFDRNSADTGGAIHSNANSVNVTNSTFVGNSAVNHGAIDSRVGTVTVSFSTFYGNTATGNGNTLGDQQFGTGGNLQVGNSILYGPDTDIDVCDVVDGSVDDLGNNLTWPVESNCPGTQVDPRLATRLADNGGPTQTLALLSGSPAIDAGGGRICPETDQRGVARPQGEFCDIGAFERPSINIFSVINTNDSGAGSLRQAILDANNTPNTSSGPDEIHFNIPSEGTNVIVIAPTSALREITEAVVIDGYTQPGARLASLATGDSAIIRIELDGASCDSCGQALLINSDGSTIKGLAIQGSFNNGIEVNGSGNTITGNIIASTAGNGVKVASGTGNTIVGNSIYANKDLGIDLGGDGVTFNHLGTVSGPNNYQNYPVLYVATSDGTSTRLVGTLESEAAEVGQTYSIHVYANPSCNPSFFGEGQTYLGSFDVTTNASGFASFDETITRGTNEPQGITVTATGNNGTSEFSYCRPSSTSNLNWHDAQLVESGSQTQQFFTDIFQEKWFKFPVQPGSSVSIKLTSLPGSAVSLHRDPHPIYKELIDPQNSPVLSAQASDPAFLPSGSLPSGSLPSGSLPSGSLPSGSLPSGSLPTGYLPSGSLPSGSLPSGSLPSGSLPSGSLPSGSLPSGSLPSGSLPSGSLPSGSLPSGSLPSGSLPSGSLPSGSLPSGSLPSGSLDAYATAARQSLLGISMDPYATVQTIERNTYDLQEDLYVRVVGPYNLETPFTLEVTVNGGICADVEPVPSTLDVISGSSASGSYQSLILTDSGRLHGTSGQITTALADLQTLAERSDVNGVVVDLAEAQYQRVAFANTQADANPACPSAKNTVVKEIKKVIDAYRAVNPTLQYIVLAGGADVIPFFQTQDLSGLANEKDYVPPVKSSTASEAGLATNLVQGQDAYGSQVTITQAGFTLALPNLAVGRLVDSASDISAAVNAYILTNGVIAPGSSLVTGYDFVGDAAVAIKAELDAGTNSTADTLIQAPGLPPTDPTAWTANQLRAKLLAGNFDIAMLSGHFSAGNLLAADYTTQLSASEIAASATDMRNVLVLTLGCHGGYSIPQSDLFPVLSPDPDWAKTFLRKGAAGYIAATGYAYGDTELTEYGERLFLRMAQQLRTGSGPVSIGQAVVKAKQQYLAETAQLTGIDQKTLVEMTLYGLPMMKVNMPGARITPPSEFSKVTSITPISGGPGADFSLSSGAIVLNSTDDLTTSTNRKDLENLSTEDPGDTIATFYLSGKDEVIANPFEPIYPKAIFNVSADNLELRGVALRGGTYTDLSQIDGEPFVPLTSSPTTETSTAHLSYNTDVFYPTQVWAPNYYDTIAGGKTRLIVFPAQFKSSDFTDINGTLRKFDKLDLRSYYLPADWTNENSPAETKAAAVSAAPNIQGVSAVMDNSNMKFSVNVVAEGSAGVQAVWVLYTGKLGSSYHGMWTALDLTQNQDDPILWEGEFEPTGNAEDIQFMVQAVGGAGLTTLATDLGAYYSLTPPTPPQPPAATTLVLQSPPATGTYLQKSIFNLLLQSGGLPLSDQFVSLDIGGQKAFATTNDNGEATIDLTLVVPPGNYTAQASFRGNADYLGSNDVNPFTVAKDTTTLTVTPISVSVFANQPTPFVAVVRDSSGRALGGKSVFFIVHNSTNMFAKSVIADYQGNATLGVVPLPAGTYTVDAYFNGTIPLTPIITLSDDYYESSRQLGLSLQLMYAFTGFFDPVKNTPVMNQMNAGRAVPLKFSLGGNQGLNIFAANFPQSRRINCDTQLPIDPVEQTTTAGSSSLSYDPATGIYTYVWKTDKAWAGTCRQVSVKFIDGQTYLLNFTFTR